MNDQHFKFKTNIKLCVKPRKKKQAAVASLCNLLWPGLGNIYVCGLTAWGCWPLYIASILLLVFHSITAWVFLFVITSLIAYLAIDIQNTCVKLDPDPTTSYRAVNEDEQWEISSHQEGNHQQFVTEDMRRKLGEAHIKFTVNGKAVDKAYMQNELQHLFDQVVGTEAASQHGPPSQADENKKSAPQTVTAYGSAGVSNSTGTPAPSPDWLAKPDDLGAVNYNMYPLPQSNSASTQPDFNWPSNGNQALRQDAPQIQELSTPIANTAIDPSTVTTNASVGEKNKICHRCGTVGKEDQSFCLNCGHSYAFS